MQTQTFGPTASAEQTCYEYMRERVLSGDLSSGTEIHQQAIANALGVSRIPVRDALKHLVMEGLVTANGKRHVVKVVSREDIEEIFLMRSVLEGLSARLSAERLSGDVFATLKRIATRMERAETTEGEWMGYHDEFHGLIHAAVQMPLLQIELTRLQTASEHYRRAYFETHHFGEIKGHEHRRIVSAIATRNPDTAERAMRSHVEAALKATRQLKTKNLRTGRGAAPNGDAT